MNAQPATGGSARSASGTCELGATFRKFRIPRFLFCDLMAGQREALQSRPVTGQHRKNQFSTAGNQFTDRTPKKNRGGGGDTRTLAGQRSIIAKTRECRFRRTTATEHLFAAIGRAVGVQNSRHQCRQEGFASATTIRDIQTHIGTRLAKLEMEGDTALARRSMRA